MPRYVYDAGEVKLLQKEGQVVPTTDVDWSESSSGVLSDEPVEGFAIVPHSKVSINQNAPFQSEQAAEVELREIREWPEPSDQDAADEVPWPQSAA